MPCKQLTWFISSPGHQTAYFLTLFSRSSADRVIDPCMCANICIWCMIHCYKRSWHNAGWIMWGEMSYWGNETNVIGYGIVYVLEKKTTHYSTSHEIYTRFCRALFCLGYMMTAWNGNIFRNTCHLCGEFAGHRGIPYTKADDTELFSLICTWVKGWVNNREFGDLRRHRAHYDCFVMVMIRSLWYNLVHLLIIFSVALLALGQSIAAVTAKYHCNDVIMSAMVSQITSPTIVCSTVYSGADPRKHQSSASLAFVRGIHRWPVNSPHKWPVTRKMFPFDDVIMPWWDMGKNRSAFIHNKTKLTTNSAHSFAGVL